MVQQDHNKRGCHNDHWPSHRVESHWHTYGIGGLLIVISLMGWFVVDTLQVVRDDIKEVKITVEENAKVLVEVQKKLTAVVTKESLLRKTVDRHLDKEHPNG